MQVWWYLMDSPFEMTVRLNPDHAASTLGADGGPRGRHWRGLVHLFRNGVHDRVVIDLLHERLSKNLFATRIYYSFGF